MGLQNLLSCTSKMKQTKAEEQIKKLKALLKEIADDCLQLEKENELTEYGKGQFDLIRIIRKELF